MTHIFLNIYDISKERCYNIIKLIYKINLYLLRIEWNE